MKDGSIVLVQIMYGLSPTQSTRKRIALTDQGIEQSKRTALKLTRQRTSRASMEMPGRVHLMSIVTRSRREGSSSASKGGYHHLSSIVSKSSCDCDDTDIDMIYRMCCISVENSPSYKAATLFDTGTHASFVNREVATWIEEHGRTDRRHGDRKRGWQEASGTTVSLAGTSMSSPILGRDNR